MDVLNQLFEETYYNATSFPVALFSLLLAFSLSTVIAFTYRYTVSNETFSRNFFQAIVLSSMVSSMVIMAVGSNIAVGFGIIGAIAIIRFRTIMRNPRNIIFIFAALSVGVATGVYGYAIALSGTLVFCLVAFLLKLSPYGKGDAVFYDVRVDVDSGKELEVSEVMRSMKLNPEVQTISHQPEGVKRIRFEIRISGEEMINDLYDRLMEMDGVHTARVARALREQEL